MENFKWNYCLLKNGKPQNVLGKYITVIILIGKSKNQSYFLILL